MPLRVTESFWEDLAAGKLGNLDEGRLVTSFSFSADWNVWEMHPDGEEFVCLLSGTAELVLDQEGGHCVVHLHRPGAYVIVPRGTWHTAKAAGSCSMLFITAGKGTVHRPVE